MDRVHITDTDPVALVRRARAQGVGPPFPVRLMLQVTNLCNSRCKMCGIWRIYRDEPELLPGELAPDEWLRLLENAVRDGVRHVSVTGGEPFVKQGIVELTIRILQLLGFTGVVTNAIAAEMTARKIEKILDGAPADSRFSVTVSLDGLPATHAALRGVEDGYARVCELLSRLRELQAVHPGLSRNVSFTLQRENLHELVPLLQTLLDSNLIESPDNFYFRPVASAHYYRAENQAADASAIVKEIERAEELFGFKATRAFVRGIKVSVRDPRRMVLPCYALFASCWIDPYGNVSPCVTMTEEHIGNVREHDFDIAPIWRSAVADKLRDRIARDACPVCWTDCQANENIFYAGDLALST